VGEREDADVVAVGVHVEGPRGAVEDRLLLAQVVVAPLGLGAGGKVDETDHRSAGVVDGEDGAARLLTVAACRHGQRHRKPCHPSPCAPHQCHLASLEKPMPSPAGLASAYSDTPPVTRLAIVPARRVPPASTPLMIATCSTGILEG